MANYPDRGKPVADFLYHRARAIRHLYFFERKTFEAIVAFLNLKSSEFARKVLEEAPYDIRGEEDIRNEEADRRRGRFLVEHGELFKLSLEQEHADAQVAYMIGVRVPTRVGDDMMERPQSAQSRTELLDAAIVHEIHRTHDLMKKVDVRRDDDGTTVLTPKDE